MLYTLILSVLDLQEDMCHTDWITLFDDDAEDERVVEAFVEDSGHLWPKKELKVFFMNKIPPWDNDKDGYISKEEIIGLANEWHDCGRDVVPKFVKCDDRASSDIRVKFIGMIIIMSIAALIFSAS